MIKSMFLGVIPLVAAIIYGQREPEPLLPPFHAVETEDRIFLANLDVQEAASRESAARAEQVVAQRLASQPAPKAVVVALPVATPPPARQAPPIPRATLVRAATPATTTPATSAADVTLAFGGTSLMRHDPETMPAGAEPEVRRAMPVTKAIPVARAVPVMPSSNRASIVIYQGEVFTFPAYGRR
ncbi:MAG: hypothetical protein ABJF10_20215 [Chthoniobacter sp.]|uniref:hypothetical protein n=1 Tax=Chthoniobacter sp. TaxID=2510640 RepID=UPI0032AE44DD